MLITKTKNQSFALPESAGQAGNGSKREKKKKKEEESEE
jgi:hypothetical protein